MSQSRRGLLRANTPEFEWALQEAWEDANHPQPGEPIAPKPLCDGREAEFTDYKVAPSPGAAEDMCAGCPFMDYVPVRDMYLPNGVTHKKGTPLGSICRKNARMMKPNTGVWGGEVWENGKRRNLRITSVTSGEPAAA